MHKLKLAFNKRFDAFIAKAKLSNQNHLQRLSLVILKAYVKKKRLERHQTKMALFCKEKLRYLKMRRVFKCLKMFSNWQ